MTSCGTPWPLTARKPVRRQTSSTSRAILSFVSREPGWAEVKAEISTTGKSCIRHLAKRSLDERLLLSSGRPHQGRLYVELARTPATKRFKGSHQLPARLREGIVHAGNLSRGGLADDDSR